MGHDPIDESSQLPWTARVYARVPMSPVHVGIAIGVALLTLFFASEWALGRFELLLGGLAEMDQLPEVRITLVHILLTAYGPTALVVLIQRNRRTWRELQGLLGLSDSQLEQRIARVGHRPAWLTFSLLIFGVFVWVLATYWTTPEDPFDTQVIVLEVVWHRVLGPIMILYTVWVTLLIVTSSWLLSAAARGIVGLDLLDPDQLAPFKSQALMNSLIVFGMGACASPLGIEEHMFGLIISIWVFAFVVAVIGLLLPLVGLRDLIRSTRARELAWSDAQLRAARDGLKTGAAQGGTPSFAELYAYRQRLEHVSEWPLDAPSFVRFSLYLLIPLGSWLGGAVVERLVDAVVQ